MIATDSGEKLAFRPFILYSSHRPEEQTVQRPGKSEHKSYQRNYDRTHYLTPWSAHSLQRIPSRCQMSSRTGVRSDYTLEIRDGEIVTKKSLQVLILCLLR